MCWTLTGSSSHNLTFSSSFVFFRLVSSICRCFRASGHLFRHLGRAYRDSAIPVAIRQKLRQPRVNP